MRRETEIIEPNEIDFKKFLYEIHKHRYIVWIITGLFVLFSTYYAYFEKNIYQATVSVEVGLDRDRYKEDFIAMAMGKGAVSSDTEKDLITSRYLRQKALKKVDFTHHYYTTGFFKEIEIYKDAPFDVSMVKGYGVSFDLKILDEKKFRLVVKKAKSADGSSWSYDKVHRFNEPIKTKYFELTVKKTREDDTGSYRFVIDETNRSFGTVNVSQNSQNTTVLQISCFDTVARRAQEFANALAKAYVEQNVENRVREAEQKLAFINRELEVVDQKLKVSAQKLEIFRKQSKAVKIDSKIEAISLRVDEYGAELTSLMIKEQMLKDLKAQILIGKDLETISIEGLDDKGSSLATLVKQLQEAILSLKLLKEDYTDMHPLVKKDERKVEQLKRLISNTVDNSYKNIEKRKTLLSQEIEKQEKILNTLPANERTYGQLERKFKMNDELNSYLLQQKAEQEMIKASTVSKNRILDHALLPSTQVKPKRLFIILFGTLLGLVISLIVILIKVFFDTKIKSLDDITNRIDHPIIGTIPNILEQKEVKNKIKVFESPKSAVSEAFRNMRTNIHFLAQEKKSKVILVTSTVSEEGKTTVSINLGAIMSLTKKRTILVNLDMRKPTLHSKFGLPNSTGMSELLAGACTLDEAIQETRYEYLDIISSGPIPPNPSELIQSHTMIEILNELKERYDVIILDTPPVGLVADAKGLMMFTDVNLFVFRNRYSKKEYLDNFEHIVIDDNIEHIGIVYNDVRFDSDGYGYNGSYGYGYSGYGYYEDEIK